MKGTGAEAMFADLGHFSKLPIRMAFMGIVYPCLVFAYMGEAAYLSKHKEDLQRSFFKAIPEGVFWPVFVIATLATTVGCQAIISATFSIISQCRAFGCFPRVKIIHTSNNIHGQIYIPEVNWLLMLLCLALTIGFRNTDTIVNAYVINAILACGKQLSKIHVEDEDVDGYEVSEKQTLKSTLLRRLIHTAASSIILTHARELLSSLDNDAANRGDMLNLFIASSSQFPEVYKGRINVEMAEEELNSLIVQYRKQLGMRKLEYISISGTTHLIELPTDARVPTDWVKINSTKKTVRYHPPEVLKALDGLSLAKEELAVICKTTWSNFLSWFSNYYGQFQAAVQAIAALDCLHSLAILSKNLNYVRPVFVNEDEPCQVYIQSGHHPVLGSILGDNFVPNDTNLHADSEYCQIVTGPNMGGKSCYIRQVALLAIMAQVGSFIPALSAKFHVLDGIYTRMGASDNIQQGRSTFFEELSEASYTLRNCSSKSLVILDELGRGTSTHDGVAIAYSTLHYLLKHKKCMVLFVTHYPQILDIQNEFRDSVGAYHVSYFTSEQHLENMVSESEVSARNIDKSEVTFLYKVVSGASNQSFGLNVAKLAQLPPRCIERAAFMAAKFEADVKARRSYRTQKLIFTLQKFLSYIRTLLNDYNQDNVLNSLMTARELAISSLSDVGNEQLLLETSSCK